MSLVPWFVPGSSVASYQLTVALLLAAALAGLAVFFARQQVLTLRGLPHRTELTAEDRHYFRRRAWRRLFGSFLLGLVAVMLVGAHVSGLEAEAADLGRTLDAERERSGRASLTPEQRQFGKVYASYWASLLLVVLVLVGLAAVDFWAIRRYGQRQLREIRADRRAALAEYAAERRRRRMEPGSERP